MAVCGRVPPVCGLCFCFAYNPNPNPPSIISSRTGRWRFYEDAQAVKDILDKFIPNLKKFMKLPNVQDMIVAISTDPALSSDFYSRFNIFHNSFYSCKVRIDLVM